MKTSSIIIPTVFFIAFNKVTNIVMSTKNTSTITYNISPNNQGNPENNNNNKLISVS